MPQPAPPSGLAEGLSHQADKQTLVNWVFDRVAPRYDLGNDVMSLGMHTRWKRRLVQLANIAPHHRVLDLACGTGDTTIILAPLAREVVGTDINASMMDIARTKVPAAIDNVTFVRADAADLPFEDQSFDRITCTYAGRGFPDWPGVIREAHRVLKPGGTFWNLDFARPPSALVDRAYRQWLLLSGALLGTALHGSASTYMYIPISMVHYPGQRWLADEMGDAGFEVELIETTLGLMAFNGGTRPTLAQTG